MDFFDFVKTNKLTILIISLIVNVFLVIAISTVGILYFQKDDNTNEKINTLASAEPINNENDQKFYVEVKGAVNKPGVYAVNKNNILNDVILMAEGFKDNAYTNNINLSRKVEDAMVIYVYTEKEYKNSNQNTKTVYVKEKCECPTYDISACTEDKKSEIVVSYENSDSTNNSSASVSSSNNNTSSSAKEENTKKIININTASKSDLMTLTGIGESKAVKIIEYRNTNGLFKNIDEIKNVSGIGDAMFAKIKDYITV